MPTIAIIGGGAAGFFAAIHAKKTHPKATVYILEASETVLNKVKISGGGRCNVTHACFDPRELAEFYPRGGKALLGIFSRFQPGDTMDWFETHGVPLKIESDNRIFPASNSSQSIIDCLLDTAKSLGVEIYTKRRIQSLKKDTHHFHLTIEGHPKLTVDKVVLATGSNRLGYQLTTALGHQLIAPLPSLFTVSINDPELRKLSGLSVQNCIAEADGIPAQSGPVLITHRGLSGPAIIKLSAWGARTLAATNYQFPLTLRWLPDHTVESVTDALQTWSLNHPLKQLGSQSPFSELPNRLWQYVCRAHPKQTTWKQLTPAQLNAITKDLTGQVMPVVGKNAFKEEFVTSGGIDLKEVDCTTMQSKRCPGLYIVGELLNIDGVTGGFNFQNAWSTGYIAGTNI